MKRFYNFLLSYAPMLLVSIPLLVLIYANYGNPTEQFFDIVNTVCLCIAFTPIIFFLLVSLYLVFNGDFDNAKDKCKCCCKCYCCKEEV